MQIFEFRDEVVGDYGEYIVSFISIADPRIREAFDRALKDGAFVARSVGPNQSARCSDIHNPEMTVPLKSSLT
jgi:hypothetical protein